MQDFINITLLALLGSVIALVGGVAFLYVKPWSKVLERYATSFAAGVLLTVALIALLPEAVDLIGERAFLIALVTFLIAFIFENVLFDIHHHDSHSHSVKKGSIPLLLAGDTIHNFVDGVAIAAAYFVNPGLGLITALSTFLHEVPHEIGDFGILLKAGWSKSKIMIVNILSALSILPGAYFVLFLTPNQTVIGVFLAIATGLFLYLGAVDFLPHIHEGEAKPTKCVASVLIGVAVMLAVFSLIPHSHEENEDSHNSDEHSEEFVDTDYEVEIDELETYL